MLLLFLLPFMRRLARDPAVMGSHVLGRGDSIATGVALAFVALSVVTLLALTVL